MSARVIGCVALCLALGAGPACVSRPIPPAPSVAFEATEALFEAQAALQARPERTAAARAACERAAILAPGWVAPLRMLDELERLRLRGVLVLQEHRAALALDPADARRLYLAGRLEGREGRRRFETAVRFDPTLAWGWHGLAFAAAAEGRNLEAVAHAHNALARAVDPWERTFFQTTLARQLAAAGQSDDALEFLEARARAENVTERERTWLQLTSVEIGLEGVGNRVRERAYEKGLDLLRERDLSDADLESLMPRMRRSLYLEDLDGVQLALALAARAGATRERLRAETITTPSSRAVIARALSRDGRDPPAGSRARLARFATFEFARAVDDWRASLPKVVVDADGMPRDPLLAHIVRLGRKIDAESSAQVLIELGDALIEAGWFREARHVAARLTPVDLDAALTLENRALAGITILDGLERVARRSDRPPPRTRGRDRGESEASKRVGSLAELLDALAPLFARARRFLGGETDVAAVERLVRASPRMKHGGIAQLVHPGPRFSAADERNGLGRAGEPVGGIAALFASIGRFAIIGEVLGGGGADGCVLPKVWEEWRFGEHLGVKWRGTVVWCEAADLKSRAGRQGAMISAAALHEGYWIDIDAVRDEFAGWSSLRRRFSSQAEVQGILASTGLPLDARAGDRERRSTAALLGESSRVRLAVLRDRASENAGLGVVTLDDVLEATAIHEEGHLCDRTRFLPLLDHKLALLVFLTQCHFSPTRIGEELELRAQLTCLCASPDPRIALAQILDAGEGSSTSTLTPHSAGYKRLLEELLRVLDDSVQRDPSSFPSIDRTLSLAHQLHRMPIEEVRRLALLLAERKGL